MIVPLIIIVITFICSISVIRFHFKEWVKGTYWYCTCIWTAACMYMISVVRPITMAKTYLKIYYIIKYTWINSYYTKIINWCVCVCLQELSGKLVLEDLLGWLLACTGLIHYNADWYIGKRQRLSIIVRMLLSD